MEQFAIKCYEEHKAVFEHWNYGSIDEIWTDENGILCIRYTSGKWWHYAIEDNSVIWW